MHNSSLFAQSSPSILNDRRGFVAIIVVLLIGFLTVVTASLLWLFVEENKITRGLSSGIALQYGSESALEYALLKQKNHDHGFEDKLGRSDSCDPSTSLQDLTGSIAVMSRSMKIGYAIESQVKSYTGEIAAGGYEIIPLYVDEGDDSPSSLNCSSLKQSSTTASPTFEFTKNFKLDITLDAGGSATGVTWNILASSGSTDTVGLAGSGVIIDDDTEGVFRMTQEDAGDALTTKPRYVVDISGVTIANFLSGTTTTYTRPFLVLFNNQNAKVTYNLTSQDEGGADTKKPFSSPRPCIYATSQLGDGANKRGQFYKFCQDNSALLEGLKYSVFSK